ncbi:MAG TPA: hypothetical protein VFI65_20215 [Streptosporangiaceae bacterium]|nr:hypothetical protein [Streptosporangiaceae bacterium]
MLACQFHWSYTELMTLDHAERRRWVRQAELLASRETGWVGRR